MNLVNELQISAESEDVLMVLRKTQRLASKLGRQDISTWLQAEQQGYSKAGADVPIPDYRIVATTLAVNTNGYIPAGFGMVMNGIQELPHIDLDLPFDVREPISTIMTWIEGLRGKARIFQNVPAACDGLIRKYIGVSGSHANQVSFLLGLNSSQIKAIPERIKDKVLEWACALEAAGVTGEGMTFSPHEKQIATAITFNIQNSQIEQLSNMGSNRKG